MYIMSSYFTATENASICGGTMSSGSGAVLDVGFRIRRLIDKVSFVPGGSLTHALNSLKFLQSKLDEMKIPTDTAAILGNPKGTPLPAKLVLLPA